MTSTTRVESVYCEDYSPGRIWEWGELTISKDEIVAFARQFDPHPFHLDDASAERSVFRGLTASGVHTIALENKMFHLDSAPRFHALAQLGMTDVSFPNPVRPGDTLRISLDCTSVRESASKPDRGIAVQSTVLTNQRGEICMLCAHTVLVPKRGLTRR